MHAGATVVNRQQLPHGDVWLVANVNLGCERSVKIK